MKEQSDVLKRINKELEVKTSDLEKQKEEVLATRSDIERKAKDLELANKYKSEFLANMQLLRLIADIIDVAKIEAGEMKITFDRCKLNNLLRELEIQFNQLRLERGKFHGLFYRIIRILRTGTCC